LSADGVEVVAPALPNPRHPDIKQWLKVLKASAGQLDEQTVLVGHSLGCALILRFLSDYQPTTRIAGLVLVAGAIYKARPGQPKHHSDPLMNPPLDLGKIIATCRRRIVIYSDNDRVVKPEWSKRLAQTIQAEAIEDTGKGHFSGPKGLDQLPSVLSAVTSCFKDS
jgi:uncharacterized protein